MLDLGFIHALKRIVALVPPKRQTLFFSATMPRAIKELADNYLTNPAEVSVTPTATTVDRIEQSVTMVNQAEKTGASGALILKSEPVERALVFSRTKHGADKIVRQLEAAGIAAGAIHGNKSQAQRERAHRRVQVRATCAVLIATDIAARGIDIPGVSHVVNFDLPDVPEQYVHRIGRTARAGADGIAIAFCAPDERGNLRDIERTTRQQIAGDAAAGGFRGRGRSVQAAEAGAQGAAGPQPAFPAALDQGRPPPRRPAPRQPQRRPAAPCPSRRRPCRPSFGHAGPHRPAPRRSFAAARRRAAAAGPASPTGRKPIARLGPSGARQRRPDGGQPKRNSTASVGSAAAPGALRPDTHLSCRDAGPGPTRARALRRAILPTSDSATSTRARARARARDFRP